MTSEIKEFEEDLEEIALLSELLQQNLKEAHSDKPRERFCTAIMMEWSQIKILFILAWLEGKRRAGLAVERGVARITETIGQKSLAIRNMSGRSKTLTVLLLSLGSLMSLVAYLYKYNPKLIILAIRSWNRQKSGIKMKCIKDASGFKYSYGERGQKKSGSDTIIMVPGLGGTVDNWVPIIAHMRQGRHIIAVELPGLGETSCMPEIDLNIAGQVERLREFIKLMQMSGRCSPRVFLIGSATGGTIAGCYAAKFPAIVSKLILVCPVVRSAELSESTAIELGGRDSGLVADSPEGINRSIAVRSRNAKPLSKQLAKGAWELSKSKMFRLRKLADSMMEEIYRGDKDIYLGSCIQDITAPTYVVWGRHDKSCHVSGAESVKQGLKTCRGVEILENAGHAIFLDDPLRMARIVDKFYQEP